MNSANHVNYLHHCPNSSIKSGRKYFKRMAIEWEILHRSAIGSEAPEKIYVASSPNTSQKHPHYWVA